MLIVGVTGGIGAGKSTVCEVFSTLGIPIYNADQQAKVLMNEDTHLIEKITEAFGSSAYQDNQLNRDFLAKKVFSNGNEIQKLNAIVHPAVAKDFEEWVANQSSDYVIKEAALLIESGSYKDLDVLINVSADQATRIDRVLQRDTFRKKEEIQEIVKKQTSEDERRRLSDYVIQNDGKAFVIPQVMKIHESLLRQAKN